jgi:curved DNA-binding protein CbpA
MAKDYYSILSVSRTATAVQIRDRFRELARTRHPDRFQGADKSAVELEFQEITEAFNVLHSPERRRLYDQSINRAEPRNQASDAHQLARVYLQRGIKAYREKNFVEAAESFDRAAKADDGNAQAWHHLALACVQGGRWQDRAVEAIRHACELQPMNPTYLKLAGKIFAESGMTPEAEQYYNQALDWGGDDPAIRQALEDLKKSSKRSWSGLFGRGD